MEGGGVGLDLFFVLSPIIILKQKTFENSILTFKTFPRSFLLLKTAKHTFKHTHTHSRKREV